jgi:hypothetical protein
MGGITNEKSDPERDRSRGVGIVLDELAQQIVTLDGDVLHLLRAVHGGIDGLPVGVLGSTRRLVDQSLSLHLRVAGDLTDALFDFSGDVPDGADRTILIHLSCSLSQEG